MQLHQKKNIWVFPKIEVPQNGWFMIEHPIKMDDLGVPPFSETSIYIKQQQIHNQKRNARSLILNSQVSWWSFSSRDGESWVGEFSSSYSRWKSCAHFDSWSWLTTASECSPIGGLEIFWGGGLAHAKGKSFWNTHKSNGNGINLQIYLLIYSKWNC